MRCSFNQKEINMRPLGALSFLTVAMALLPGMAQAQAAYTARDVHLRAGPSPQYLSIAVLPAGFQISVQGCLSNYSWCDVIAGPNRGWVYAANINYPYQSAYVPVLNYGAVIGIAVVGFIVGDYWTEHYRDRPGTRIATGGSIAQWPRVGDSGRRHHHRVSGRDRRIHASRRAPSRAGSARIHRKVRIPANVRREATARAPGNPERVRPRC
jgi:uncharacterized protein YraI